MPTPIPPITPNTRVSIIREVAVEASSQPSPQKIPPIMVTIRGWSSSTYLPVRSIVIAKTAMNTENGISTSLTVTACPSPREKYAMRGSTKTLHE